MGAFFTGKGFSDQQSWRRRKHNPWDDDLNSPIYTTGLPRWLNGKESACNAGDTRDMGLIPASGRYPAGGNGDPLQYFRLENPMGRGAWWATVHRFAKSQTRLSTHVLFIFKWEGDERKTFQLLLISTNLNPHTNMRAVDLSLCFLPISRTIGVVYGFEDSL